MDRSFKQRFVLDTSLFMTEEIRRDEETLEAAIDRLLDLIAAARLELDISCYMPPSIHSELTTMLDDRQGSAPTRSTLTTWVVRKQLVLYTVSIPADVVYRFVD